MRVLLIAVPLVDRIGQRLVPIAMDRYKTSPPLGIYLLAAIAREAGHDVQVLDLIAHGSLDLQRAIDAAGRCDVVGVSANSLNWPSARMVVDAVKEAFPRLPAVMGGIHPTSFPDHVLRHSKADYLICGEGDHALPSLLAALAGRIPLRDVPGLAWIEDGFLHCNPNPALGIDEISALPDPAYDLLPGDCYESLSVESSRGCRFSCTFCSTRFRGSWRALPADLFVGRLERLQPQVDRTIYKAFSFIDDLFTFDAQRVIDIARRIDERAMDVWATLDARVTDIIKPGVAHAIEPMVSQMLVGAECGYNEGLKAIRKGASVEIIERAAAVLHDIGLAPRTVFSFIIGFPFETADDCRRTIEFATGLLQRYNVRIYLQWFNAIPGSELWDALVADGDLDIAMYDEFGFLTNERIFRTGIRLPLDDIRELSATVRSLNMLLFLTRPAADVLQFAQPDWLNAPTLDLPSKGILLPKGP